jgi:hypothetical protein
MNEQVAVGVSIMAIMAFSFDCQLNQSSTVLSDDAFYLAAISQHA